MELRKILLFMIDIASIMFDDRVIDGIHRLQHGRTISDMGNSRRIVVRRPLPELW